MAAAAQPAAASAFDAASLLLAVDRLPPASFDLGSSGWAPTRSLAAHVRALPAPGPLRVRQRARLVANERMDEVCDVVDARGVLVAVGFQLAGLRLPDGPPAGADAAPRDERRGGQGPVAGSLDA